MARSPLFDIYDPQGLLQDQLDLGLPDLGEDIEPFGVAPLRRRKPSITDLMPEEQRSSMLQGLSQMGSSGLTALGWLLDTPGSMVRGTLSGLAEGDPLKGLRALGQTSDERVSGRDLARQFGLAGKEDSWLNFGGSLLAEAALDPLTYLNPLSILGRGAYSAAGRALSRAGLLDNAALQANKQGVGVREFLRNNTPRKIIGMSDNANAFTDFANAARGKGLNPDDLLDAPIAGLAEFRIPGMERGALLGTGKIGDAIASGLDDFGEEFLKKNRFTAPLVNRARAAFDPTVMGEIDPSKQWRNRDAFAEATKNERNYLEWLAELQRNAETVTHNDFGFSNPRIQAAVRDTIEAKLNPERIAKLQDQEAISALEAVPEWKAYRDDVADRLQQSREEALRAGIDVPNANSMEDTGFFPAQAAQFRSPRQVVPPSWAEKRPNPYNRGPRILNTDDVFGRGRNPKTDLERRSETFRRLMGGDFGRDLQAKLFGATPEQIPGYMDEAFAALGMEAPYSKIAAETITDADGNTVQSLSDFLTDPGLMPSERTEWTKKLAQLTKRQEAADLAATAQRDALKVDLGEMLVRADRQFADNGMGLFDNSTVNDMARYGTGLGRSIANAKVILDDILPKISVIPASQMPGGGAMSLADAAGKLGFDKAALTDILNNKMGREIDLNTLSIDQSVVQDLMRLSPNNVAKEPGLLGRAYKSFTNAFKIGALANPAYHTRNLYSGQLATLTGSGGNPFSAAMDAYAGWQAGKGNYDPLYQRIKDAPQFHGLSQDEAIDKLLRESARNRLGGGQIFEDGAVEQASRSLYPGGEAQPSVPWFGEGGLLYDPDRTWREWSSIRGVQALDLLRDQPPPAETLNPWLNLHERVGKRVEDANRLGAYISQLRQGASPDAAANMVYKTQVDYSPRAFTDFERTLKEYIPFYSYPRGIAPLVAENLLYRPGGLQGQSIRAISRASEPNEEFFLPEHLRQSAAIALPAELGGRPAENLQRVVNNIDLPYESLVNLFSPGIGNTLTQKVTDSLQKTGMNLLGQLNPVVKAPLEMILNRQLYSGRELSDLYSVLERDLGPIGRPLEQILVNAPGGSKLNSIYRTATDDRLSMGDKALKLLVNNTLGLKITDVDQERTKRLAARETLNQLLSTAPGVRTYENITVPEDVLRGMPKEQQDMYLLYKIIQAEAAKRARDKKRAETALDPLQVLGVLN